MKLILSILAGLLIAILILKFTNLESYVLAPVTYERAMEFNPGEEEARIIRAVAAASGTKIDETQARAALAAAAPPAGPPPIMALPGTVTPMAAPSPVAAQQIMAQPPAVVQAAEAAKAMQASSAAQADAGGAAGAAGGAFTGGAAGSITQITGGGAPLMGAMAIQPVTAGAAGFGAPAPAPKAAAPRSGAPEPAPRARRARAPAPPPKARGAQAPPPKGPKTRQELILEEIDEILAKLRG